MACTGRGSGTRFARTTIGGRELPEAWRRRTSAASISDRTRAPDWSLEERPDGSRLAGSQVSPARGPSPFRSAGRTYQLHTTPTSPALHPARLRPSSAQRDRAPADVRGGRAECPNVSGCRTDRSDYGLIAATSRVAAHGPAAYQKRTPSERRSVIFSPQASISLAYARV